MTTAFEKLRDSDWERYGGGRHGDLPWGYWLVSSGTSGQSPVIDEDGREWPSVRDAFWCGRLGFPDTYASNHVLEFMASYMAIMDGRFVPDEERVRDVFDGDHHADVLFGVILEAAGLVDKRSRRLTPEGRAVLLMLIATRNHDNAQDDVGMDWIVVNRTVAGWKERQSAAEQVERAEQVAGRMMHRFATDEIDGQPAIKLIGLRITREIPVRSTLWTMMWEGQNRYDRDRFYLWLLERIDRWDAWSDMVTREGARALTEHFMKLAFCDRFVGAEAAMPRQD